MLMITVNFFAQDSIVNYLDSKENKTKKSKAFFVETLVKKNDLWVQTLYHRNRKIKKKGQYVKKINLYQ